MARPRPYLFCRYSLVVDEEVLDIHSQLAALQELQGKFFVHRRSADREGMRDTVIMRPRLTDDGDGDDVLTWSVGQKIDTRVGMLYNERADELNLITINDGTVRYNDFVAIPRLGVVAVDDRTGESHLNAKSAISRLRSAFRNIEDGAVNIEMTTTAADMDHALKSWELTEVTFKVRPINPYSSSELSRQLSDAMEKEGIGTLRGVARTSAGVEMRLNEGPLAQAHSLTNDGYGQMGVRGVMADGHKAYIPRPKFEEEKRRNCSIQTKPRELRVYIETENDSDEESFANAAKALVDFYNPDRREDRHDEEV